MGVLEARLGGLERLLGDYCVVLNGIGRFQNALGTFQEAPERKSLIFEWLWEVWVGGAPRTRHHRAGIVRPPKTRFFKTEQTPQDQHKRKGNELG